MKKSILSSLICILFLIYAANSAFSNEQENWTQWRGPEFNGAAPEGSYPVIFSATNKLLWKAQLPGKGGSTPVVLKDRIYITSAIGEGADGEDGVLCFDWSGKLIWQVKLGKQIPGRHPRGSGSNPSIVTDGSRLFACFKSGTLAALDLNGKVLWQKNLQEEYGKINLVWDFGTSPVLADNNVIMAIMHAGGKSYLAAFDQETGKLAWKVDRNYVCAMENDQSYTTPLVIKKDGKNIILVLGADRLTGHDSKTGRMTWEIGGFNPQNRPSWRMIASPVVYKDIAVVNYGRGGFIAGVRIGGKGIVTDTAWLWSKKRIGSDVATPVVHEGKVYVVSFNGKAWALDLETGDELWSDKLPHVNGAIYSSPTFAENKLYICREEGTVYVCEITPDGLKLLNQTKFDDQFVASPVLIKNRLILRGDKYLYSIGER